MFALGLVFSLVVRLLRTQAFRKRICAPSCRMFITVLLQVMYDASGVRLHAGRQASVLNMIITELPPDHPVSDTRPLRDSLGHTPLQVGVGAMLGLIVGYIVGVTFV